MKKILILMLAICLVLPIISAAEIDNWKSFDEDVGNYGKITIFNYNFIGKIFDIKLIELELQENTAICSTNCYAEKEITLYEEGPLIDDIRFIEFKLGEEFESSIKDYNFYIQEGEKDVDDYGWVVTGKYYNGSSKQEYKKTGSHKEPNWILYNEGEIKQAGTYKIRLEGSKNFRQTVDWQIKSQGKWIDDWAIWGSATIGNSDEVIDAYVYAIDTNWWGQIFTMPINGNISKIRLNLTMEGAPIADFIISIRGVNASNAPATSGDFIKVSTASNTLTEGVNDFTFSPANYTFLENTNYTIVMRGPSIGGADRVHVGYNSSSSYVHGMYYSPSSGGAGWTLSLPEAPTEKCNGPGSLVFTAYFEGNLVTLNAPVDNYNSSLSEVVFNCSASITGASLVNISLWTNSTGIWHRNQTNSTISPITNTTLFNVTFADGTYIWGCEGGDDDGDVGFSTTNRTFSVDTTDPIILINSGNGTVNHGSYNVNHTINYTITDTTLQSCWITYNSINTTLSCSTGVPNTVSITLATDEFNATITANDSLGNQNSTFFSWTYKIFENSQTYNNETTEGNLETFSANLTLGSGLTISETNFYYGNTTNLGENFKLGGFDIIRKKDFVVPNVVDNQNITFNWSITLSDDSVINLTNFNQSVSNISIDDCSIYSTKLYNFTILDEEEQTLVTANNSIDFLINVYSLDRSTQILNYSKNVNLSTLQIQLLLIKLLHKILLYLIY